MDNGLQLLVEWLHTGSAIIWVGGYIFATLIVFPAMRRSQPAEALALFDTINLPVGRVMAISAQGVFWMGIIRGTVLGPIKSFDVLTGTGYGHAFMGAVLLTIVAVAISARAASKLRETIFDGLEFRAGGIDKVLRTNYTVIVLFALILAMMVVMRHGGF